MSPQALSSPNLFYRQVMVFIDGGYLRENLKKKGGNDEFSTGAFQQLVREFVTSVSSGNMVGELIRVYYYDAIIDEKEKVEREKQQKFFDQLRRLPFCALRLGRLVKTEKRGYKQKGVDILMAVDMLTKAYENHYEIAVLVAGDGDFVDLVEAVKNTGKRVFGAYIKDHVDSRLLDCLDNYITISDESLEKLARVSK